MSHTSRSKLGQPGQSHTLRGEGRTEIPEKKPRLRSDWGRKLVVSQVNSLSESQLSGFTLRAWLHIVFQAEISLPLPSWNIVAITWSISARVQNTNFHEEIYWDAKTQWVRMLAFLLQPGLNKYLTIIPRARMGSESIAHETEGRMGYWLRGYEGERNTCFSKVQLVGQKNIETKHLSQVNARHHSKTLQIWRALFATSGL